MRGKMKLNEKKYGVMLSYFTIAVNMIIQLIYTPVMIRLLGQSEYGLYVLVGSVVSYLSLFSLGFTGSYLRYYFRYKTSNDTQGIARLNGMFLTIFIFMSVVAIIAGTILVGFSNQIFGNKLSIIELKKAKILMEILVINIALSFPISLFDSIISAYEKFVFQRLLQLASLIFNPLICLPLLIYGYKSIMMVTVTTCITACKLFYSIIYCKKKLNSSFSFKNYEKGLLWDIANFSFFIFISMIIDQINWSIDKLILGRVAGTIEVAIYGVGTQFNNIFQSLTIAISSVFSPQVNRIVAKKGSGMSSELTDLMCKVGRMQYLLITYVFVGFVFCGRLFVIAWAGKEYRISYYVALLLIAPLVLILPHSLGIEIRRAKNQHRLVSVFMLITTIFNLVISIPLAKHFGSVGAAMGTFLCLLINMIIMDIYYIKIVEVDITTLYKNIVKLTFVEIVPIMFGLIGCLWTKLSYCFLWAVIYTIIYWGVAYFWGMNENEKQTFSRILSRISRKFIRRKN